MGFLGVDVGRTKIEFCLINSRNRILAKDKFPMAFENSKDRFGKYLLERLEPFLKQASSMYVSFPGPMDYKRGVVLKPTGLKGLWGLDLKKLLRKRTRIPLSFSGATRAFVFAEVKDRLSKYPNTIALTIGTGFGLSLVIDGNIYEPSAGKPSVFNNPLNGKVAEHYLSGPGIVRIYKGLGGKKHKSAEDIHAGAVKNEKICTRTFERFGKYLAISVAPLANAICPDAILYSGSVIKSERFFKKRFSEELRKHLGPRSRPVKFLKPKWTSAYGLALMSKEGHQ